MFTIFIPDSLEAHTLGIVDIDVIRPHHQFQLLVVILVATGASVCIRQV